MNAVRKLRRPRGDLGRFSPDDWGKNRFDSLTAVLVQVGLVAAGFDFYFVMGISVTLALAVVLTPVWWPVIRTYPLARGVVVLAPLALVWGFVLAFNSSIDHAVDTNNTRVFIGVALTGVAAFIFVLWARTIVPFHRVVLLYGLGALVNAVLYGQMSWKFDFSTPVTFVVLGLAGASASRLLPAALILVLGVIGVIEQGRSFFAFCLVAAILTIWQVVSSDGDEVRAVRGAKRWAPALLMAGVGLAIYFSASAMLTAGFFGTTLQERSVMQVETSGSLLAGGRPEWAATRALFRTTPGGYGIGVVPTWSDLQAGKAGLASINVDAGGYTNNYMFGGAFELHSGLANFWVSCGVVGLVFGLFVMFCLVRNVSALLAARRAQTIVVFSTSLALWSMLFGPLYTDWLSICIALGLSMLTVEQLRSKAGSGPT